MKFYLKGFILNLFILWGCLFWSNRICSSSVDFHLGLAVLTAAVPPVVVCFPLREDNVDLTHILDTTVALTALLGLKESVGRFFYINKSKHPQLPNLVDAGRVKDVPARGCGHEHAVLVALGWQVGRPGSRVGRRG